MVSCNSFLPLKPVAPTLKKSRKQWTILIAAGRFFYGLILVVIGLSVFNLVGKNLAAELLRLVNHWHIDSHLSYVNWLLHRAAHISNQQLLLLAVANFIYAALSFTEAVGLLFEKRWAQWLVIADTSSFIPIEISQLYQAFSWINLILLAAYIATVVYLISRLKRKPAQPANLEFSPPILPLGIR